MTKTSFENMAWRVEKYRRESGIAIYEIGKTLVEAKATFGHGEFLKFLQDPRVGFQPRAAQLFMKVAKAEDGKILAEFGVAKATQLLQLDLSQRSAVMQKHVVNKMNISELRQVINAVLGRSAFKSNFKKAQARSADYQNAYDEGFQNGKSAGYREAEMKIRLGSNPKVAWAAGVLQIKPTAITFETVKNAYRTLAVLFHPDKAVTQDCRFMQVLNEANEVLKSYLNSGKLNVA